MALYPRLLIYSTFLVFSFLDTSLFSNHNRYDSATLQNMVNWLTDWNKGNKLSWSPAWYIKLLSPILRAVNLKSTTFDRFNRVDNSVSDDSVTVPAAEDAVLWKLSATHYEENILFFVLLIGNLIWKYNWLIVQLVTVDCGVWDSQAV